MPTLYPELIDGYSQIRAVRDKIDEIIGQDHNDLRSAIIAIEQTLGTNPQGTFDSVKERLNNAYSDVTYHASGNIPRHTDEHIDSAAKTGSPYALSSGTVKTQLISLLGYLNVAMGYPGSGSVTMADGYTFPTASINDTITNIIRQLGITTGSAKIGGEEIIGSTNTALPPYTLPEDTLKNQLELLLEYINNYTKTNASTYLGTEVFNSSPDGKYSFQEINIKGQLEEIGAFLNENSNFLENTFDSFVNNGMSVSQSGGSVNATVSSGFISSNGRFLSYSGGTVIINVTPGVYYIYAKIIDGEVIVNSVSSTGITFDSTNPFVILYKITHNGTTWTESIDMRRYGMFVNDKSCFTVGNTPSFGNIGYGCDFSTLRGAIEYINIINSSNTMFVPKKIIIVNDISYSGSTININSNALDGLEIDGGGRKITLTSDIPLFTINVSNVKLTKINLESSLGSAASNASLATIGNTTNISGINISDCVGSFIGSYPLAYFLKYSNSGNTTSVTKSIFKNNIFCITKGGIDSLYLGDNVTSLNNSIIDGNNFYQNSFSSSVGYGIKTSQNCIITNNKISGGFDTGIFCGEANKNIISNNIINGYDSGNYMNEGIQFYNSSDNVNLGSIVSNNSIFGIVNNGINLLKSSYITIENNIVYNVVFSSSSYGIKNLKTNTIINNNLIFNFKNGIYGESGSNNLITNNKIYDFTNYGISIESYTECLILNNDINGNSGEYGIYGISDNSLIANNKILNINLYYGIYLYGGSKNVTISNNLLHNFTSTIGCINLPSVCEKILISGNIFNEIPGIGINGGYSKEVCIKNNIFLGTSSEESSNAISLIDDNSIISSNYIYCYGRNNPLTESVIFTDGATNYILIEGNMIYGCGGSGIKCTGSSRGAFIFNNIFKGVSGDMGNSSNGIIVEQENSIILGNIIIAYGNISSSIGISCKTNSIVYGNYIDTPSLYMDSCIYTSGNNNIINSNLLYLFSNIGVHSNEKTNFIINNYIKGNGTTTSDMDSIKDSGNYSVINNNYITNSNDNGISIKGSNVFCNGNFIINTNSSAINIKLDSDNCNIINNCIKISYYGIKGGSYTDYVYILNNYIENIGAYGIDISAENYLFVSNNFLTGVTLRGISAVGDYSIISNNFLNDIGSNGISLGTPGEIGETGNNSIICSNLLYNVGSIGILINNSNYSIISLNNIKDTLDQGIKTVSSSYCNIANNIVYNTGEDNIYCDGSFCLIKNNILELSDKNGIYITDNKSELSIFENIIKTPLYCGIKFDTSSGERSLISNNKIINTSNDYSGILLSSSSHQSIISNNSITMCSIGIDCNGADDLTISGNIITYYKESALELMDCDYPIVFGNKFIDPDGATNIDGIHTNPSTRPIIIGNFAEAKGLGNGIMITGLTTPLVVGNKLFNGANPGFSPDTSDYNHSYYFTDVFG